MTTGQQSDDGKKIDRLWEANKAAADARRPAEAEERGGWIYTVGLHQTPIAVAQFYGGKRAGVLAELLENNRDQQEGRCERCHACGVAKELESRARRANGAAPGTPEPPPDCEKPRVRWGRWFVGVGLLLPVSWGDPRLKGDMPTKPPRQAAMGRAISLSVQKARAKGAKGGE